MNAINMEHHFLAAFREDSSAQEEIASPWATEPEAEYTVSGFQ